MEHAMSGIRRTHLQNGVKGRVIPALFREVGTDIAKHHSVRLYHQLLGDVDGHALEIRWPEAVGAVFEGGQLLLTPRQILRLSQSVCSA
jgi:hypothetical protein